MCAFNGLATDLCWPNESGSGPLKHFIYTSIHSTSFWWIKYTRDIYIHRWCCCFYSFLFCYTHPKLHTNLLLNTEPYTLLSSSFNGNVVSALYVSVNMFFFLVISVRNVWWVCTAHGFPLLLLLLFCVCSRVFLQFCDNTYQITTTCALTH